jgi:hypothetical protein
MEAVSGPIVHFNRLLRDGWELVEHEPYRSMWRRRHRQLPQVLHMLQSFEAPQRSGGRYVVDYTLWNEAERREQSLGRATWADWDQQGRLVLARDGRLLSCAVETGVCEPIADFSGRTPNPQPPPDGALEWPGRSSASSRRSPADGGSKRPKFQPGDRRPETGDPRPETDNRYGVRGGSAAVK